MLRYLKLSPGKGILFSEHNHLQLEAFIDADWAGSMNDRRYNSGYCTFVGGNLLTWRSKEQTVVVRSTMRQNINLWHLAFVNLCGKSLDEKLSY